MRRRGFTLLEVLLAVFMLALVMGGLLSYLTANLAALGHARNDGRAMQLASTLARDLVESAALGDAPDLGRTEGTFEEPDDDMMWELEVEPYPLPLRDPTPEQLASSSLFTPISTSPADPQPSVRRLVLRVYYQDADPEDSKPIVIFAVDPGRGALP